MNYRIEAIVSVNDDERDQTPPERDDVIAAIYDGRVMPAGIVFAVVELDVDRY